MEIDSDLFIIRPVGEYNRDRFGVNHDYVHGDIFCALSSSYDASLLNKMFELKANVNFEFNFEFESLDNFQEVFNLKKKLKWIKLQRLKNKKMKKL